MWRSRKKEALLAEVRGCCPWKSHPEMASWLCWPLDAVKDSDINILENCHPKWSVFYKTTLRRP